MKIRTFSVHAYSEISNENGYTEASLLRNTRESVTHVYNKLNAFLTYTTQDYSFVVTATSVKYCTIESNFIEIL